MSTLTMIAKGQVRLGADLPQHLGVGSGGRIEVKAARRTSKISVVFGFLKTENSSSLSIEEMHEIAARGWASSRCGGTR